ncbi:MAG: tRNA epoxyqueuosine(34) reductase QueG [Myxococcales bacterium]|nr:tRNA epoxyqueuosine(34) reductase QueG [Myxococcales bacterium]
MIDRDAIERAARRVGFEVVGVAPVEPAGGGWFRPHAERLRAWLAEGRDAEMRWMAEHAEARLVPERLLPGVCSAVVLWLPHRTPDPPCPAGPTGRVAAYAWGRDYHNVARKALRKLRRALVEADPSVGMYLSVDTSPILERAFGERAGVGWIGRSTMLIHPRLGTFGSLAVVFLDRALPAAEAAHPFRCGTCTACIDRCPTGALSAEGLDSWRCISYWTIEHRGLIPRAIRPLLGDWVFGCDVCQTVCPWNRRAPRADADRWQPKAAHAHPELRDWITTPSAELHARHEGSPLKRAFGEGLRRNALIAAANGGHRALLPAIEAVAADDPDPVLRATAVWAARVLGSARAAALAADDPDPRVRDEAIADVAVDAVTSAVSSEEEGPCS